MRLYDHQTMKLARLYVCSTILVTAAATVACSSNAEQAPSKPSDSGTATDSEPVVGEPQADTNVSAGAAVFEAPKMPQIPTVVGKREAGYVIKGCASAQRSATAAADDGKDISEAYNVSASGSAIVVAHKVPHACCLKGAVVSSVEGSTVTVREQLTGNPCRCMCGSGIETTVPVSAGTYDVKVILEVPNNAPRVVTTQKITVEAPL